MKMMIHQKMLKSLEMIIEIGIKEEVLAVSIKIDNINNIQMIMGRVLKDGERDN
jgi:hypothetical protein